MIIVKNKGVNTPIFVNRQNVISVETAEKETFVTQGELDDALDKKQNKLVSGSNIKTINGESIVGEGDIVIEADVDMGDYYTKKEVNDIVANIDVDLGDYATKSEVEAKQDELVSGENIKTINGNSILGSGNITIEGGGSGDANIIQLTQAEYDVLDTKDENTIYVITDATGIDVTLKTINGESIIGEGNITVEGGGGGTANIVELTQAEYNALSNKDADTLYLITDVASDFKTINGVSIVGEGDIAVATQEWVQTQINHQIGDIEMALTNLIGQ